MLNFNKIARNEASTFHRLHRYPANIVYYSISCIKLNHQACFILKNYRKSDLMISQYYMDVNDYERLSSFTHKHKLSVGTSI
jgi:hypothetical protein